MSDKVSKEEFYARLAGVKFEGLRDMAKEGGHTLSAVKRSDAVDEMWALYTGKIQVPEIEAPAPAPVAKTELQYEGRIGAPDRTQFIRAGYHFSRAWQTLAPFPSEEQLAALRGEPVVQIRIKG